MAGNRIGHFYYSLKSKIGLYDIDSKYTDYIQHDAPRYILPRKPFLIVGHKTYCSTKFYVVLYEDKVGHVYSFPSDVEWLDPKRPEEIDL
jgi:hypothetical protein